MLVIMNLIRLVIAKGVNGSLSKPSDGGSEAAVTCLETEPDEVKENRRGKMSNIR